jgi:hypothetical protein
MAQELYKAPYDWGFEERAWKNLGLNAVPLAPVVPFPNRQSTADYIRRLLQSLRQHYGINNPNGRAPTVGNTRKFRRSVRRVLSAARTIWGWHNERFDYNREAPHGHPARRFPRDEDLVIINGASNAPNGPEQYPVAPDIGINAQANWYRIQGPPPPTAREMYLQQLDRGERYYDNEVGFDV